MKKRTFSIGPGVDCDIERLVNSRLLLQAASGAGKSWALRRLLEQTFGSVQQLVIDPEGEFASLREKFDYVLAARQGGDTLADPRTAKLLAERLLELGASAILDISELKPHERIAFVRLFIGAIVEAPKALWHPALIVLDEAQMFAPEGSDAESADAVSSLATRGRKRGFCLVAATQRLSSLSKDVAAQLSNKLIGRTSLDVDVKRAAYELGISTQEERRALRDLEDGEFFAFGPALTKTVAKVKVGPVQTEHPKAGSALAARVPPPTDKVKALLSKLSDLPAEAEAREKTVADLKKDLATVRRELTEVRKAQPPAPKAVEAKRVEVLTDADRALLLKVEGKLDAIAAALANRPGVIFTDLKDRLHAAMSNAVSKVDEESVQQRAAFLKMVESSGVQKLLSKLSAVSPQLSHTPPTASVPRSPLTRRVDPALSTSRPARQVSEGGPGAAQRAFLTALAHRHGKTTTRNQLAVFTGYSAKSSHVDNVLSSLRTAGWAIGSREAIVITGEGLSALGEYDPLPTGDALIAHWVSEAGAAAGAMLKALVKAYPNTMTRDEVAQATGYSVESSHVDNSVSRLRTLQLVTGGRNDLRASEELFS